MISAGEDIVGKASSGRAPISKLPHRPSVGARLERAAKRGDPTLQEPCVQPELDQSSMAELI
ncbi:hypothetical protein BIW11_02234 [Tropilaelaps mercedesae]|uniref:Uncharacterized protein n=1 Tax=Tropilaelaps mercedesae TaxID=418985 RepID=A0A1V9X186_9ACAR|nr:hypothetical protein BIW11_02234 [Tropilaelaps mercedesae]